MKAMNLFYSPYTVFDTLFEAYLAKSSLTKHVHLLKNTQHTSHLYKWEFELPGFKNKNLKIETDQYFLTIKGIAKSNGYLKNSKEESSFIHQIKLMDDMNLKSIKAQFKKGILSIEIQKDKTHATYREIPVLGDNNINADSQTITNQYQTIWQQVQYNLKKIFGFRSYRS